jgi:hypothetical protein
MSQVSEKGSRRVFIHEEKRVAYVTSISSLFDAPLSITQLQKVHKLYEEYLKTLGDNARLLKPYRSWIRDCYVSLATLKQHGKEMQAKLQEIFDSEG